MALNTRKPPSGGRGGSRNEFFALMEHVVALSLGQIADVDGTTLEDLEGSDGWVALGSSTDRGDLGWVQHRLNTDNAKYAEGEKIVDRRGGEGRIQATLPQEDTEYVLYARYFGPEAPWGPQVVEQTTDEAVTDAA